MGLALSEVRKGGRVLEARNGSGFESEKLIHNFPAPRMYDSAGGAEHLDELTSPHWIASSVRPGVQSTGVSVAKPIILRKMRATGFAGRGATY